MTNPQTALQIMEADRPLRAVMTRLLHRLREFVETRPWHEGDAMPEHDVVWITYLDDSGPEQTILDAIKTSPELWAPALPEEVCIVPKESLQRLLGADAAEALSHYGGHIVNRYAAMALHEQEERERRENN